MSRSLIPSLLGLDLWHDWDYPSRMCESFFRPSRFFRDDFFAPSIYFNYPGRSQHHGGELLLPGKAEVANTCDKFQVSVDVSHFNPDDITVKTVGNHVVVHAKHEERFDEHGFISREFTRRYKLPDEAKPEAVVSSLSSDGVLTVEAPKIKGQLPSNERVIPIARKETPAVQEKAEATSK